MLYTDKNCLGKETKAIRIRMKHRRPKLTLQVWDVNLLSHKRVSVALQATVEMLCEN